MSTNALNQLDIAEDFWEPVDPTAGDEAGGAKDNREPKTTGLQIQPANLEKLEAEICEEIGWDDALAPEETMSDGALLSSKPGKRRRGRFFEKIARLKKMRAKNRYDVRKDGMKREAVSDLEECYRLLEKQG